MRIAASIARMEERDRTHQENMERLRADSRTELAGLRTDMSEFKAEIRSDIKSLRRTIVTTGITAVLAIFFGVSAVNSALLTHFMEGVDAGKRGAAEHEEIRRELRQLTIERERPANETAVAPKK
jgi:hypothetical protein